VQPDDCPAAHPEVIICERNSHYESVP